MLKPSSLVWLLVALTVLFGLVANAGIGGGSDSYGYVSQADLWIKGQLHIEQPLAGKVPWPFGQLTLTPLGYRPTADGTAIVPVYAPGLPLMFAAVKRVAGQCAIRWVVPLAGGLLVAATFGIGRIMFSDQIGAAAAWLVVTSPVVLMMVKETMSDLPAAAGWGVAIFGCLLGSRKGALLAGLAAATAILIRPNLAHVGLLMGLWLVVRDSHWKPARFDPGRTLLYGIPVTAACLAVALINKNLYGAMTSSGYGTLGAIYLPARVPANFLQYGAWLVQAETPLAVAGLIALLVPLRLLTKGRLDVAGRGLLACMCVGVIGAYLLWTVFDVWWYLRFLLSSWPAIFVSTAWLLSWPSGRTFGKAGTIVLLGLGLHGIWFSYRAGTFDVGEGERRYATVARLVRRATPAQSIILSMQHSGSVRYYGGRMTLRYDVLNRNWLDPGIAWLNQQGVHPYLLLDEWEVQDFQRRFQGESALADLTAARVFEYHASTTTYLYDLLKIDRSAERPTIFTAANVRTPSCPEPEPAPQLVLKD